MMKYALCVGNNYPGTNNELSGCVNDMNDWAELLSLNGYQVALAQEGTKNVVMQSLVSHVSRMKWGDRFIFTYSGHGTWVPDQDGDESDHRDEALYMADGELILDDDLQNVFAATPAGSGSLILSDSCHSGTVSRFVGQTFERTPRFISPFEIGLMTEERAIRLEAATTPATPRRTASLISGCADTEYSYDAWFGSRANGAFSRAGIDAYQAGISLNAWFKRIRSILPNGSYPQSPQLTAASLYRKYTKAL